MGDTVKVKALEAHSYSGKDYAAGDTYNIAADLVDSIVAQRKAERVDASAPAAKPAKSQPVEPMTLDQPAKKTAKALVKPKPTAKRARLTAKPKGKRK